MYDHYNRQIIRFVIYLIDLENFYCPYFLWLRGTLLLFILYESVRANDSSKERDKEECFVYVLFRQLFALIQFPKFGAVLGNIKISVFPFAFGGKFSFTFSILQFEN